MIAIAGGSASGKTTLARALSSRLGSQRSLILSQDHYYRDQSHHFDKDGGEVNFDHPSALDFDLLALHLAALKKSLPIEVPQYDFKTHKRRTTVEHQVPHEVVIVDGTLVLAVPGVREMFDVGIFVETDENLRFTRRVQRDVQERGRTVSGVEAQFINQVKPMHDIFVEPSKKFAGLVVSGAVPVQDILLDCLGFIEKNTGIAT